jgi:hypothetical protein
MMSQESVSPLRIEFCGVTVDVETDHAPFAEYVAGQFPGHRTPTADLAVRLRWTEGPRPALAPAAVFPDWPVETRIDRNVYAAPGRVVCLSVDDEPRLAFATAFGGPVRRFELRFHFLAAQLGMVERAGLTFFEQRVTHLERLLSGVPCYWLEVREGAPAEAMAALREVLDPAKEAAR